VSNAFTVLGWGVLLVLGFGVGVMLLVVLARIFTTTIANAYFQEKRSHLQKLLEMKGMEPEPEPDLHSRIN
jgi:hypothetical protein